MISSQIAIAFTHQVATIKSLGDAYQIVVLGVKPIRLSNLADHVKPKFV